MDTILTIVIVLAIFGILVGIHEFGHFIAAKKAGVWVQEFAFGFGPTFFRKNYKGTVYKINLIPLGGYVKLFGERKLSKDEKFMRRFEKLDDEKEDYIKDLAKSNNLSKIKDEYVLFDTVNNLQNIKQKDKEFLLDYELNQEYRILDQRRYSNKSVGQRALIISAGVIMNLFLGIIVYSLYMVLANYKVLLFNLADSGFAGANVTQLSAPVFIDEKNFDNPSIEYFNSPIIMVDGQYTTSPDIIISALSRAKSSDKNISITYFRNGKFKNTEIKDEIWKEEFNLAQLFELSGKLGVGQIIQNTPSARAGLTNNIVILKLADKEITDYDQFIQILVENQSKSVTIGYYNLETNEAEEKIITLGDKSKDDLIFGATDFYEYYPFQVFSSYLLDYKGNKMFAGIFHAYNLTKYQFDVFANIVKYSFETKDTTLLAESVGGPIKIGSEIGDLVRVGNFIDILNLTALISLSLAVMNILPIPVVDGGHLVFLFIEKIKGSPVSEKVQGVFNLLGLIFLVTLSIIVTLKDIWGLFF